MVSSCVFLLFVASRGVWFRRLHVALALLLCLVLAKLCLLWTSQVSKSEKDVGEMPMCLDKNSLNAGNSVTCVQFLLQKWSGVSVEYLNAWRFTRMNVRDVS